MRIQLHYLELVYPPISNQEVEWLKNDPEVQIQLSKSHLYFIGQKSETFFAFDDDIELKLNNESKLYFNYINQKKEDSGCIDTDKLLEFHGYPLNLTLDIEMGNKLIRISYKESGKNELIDWFTTDKILHDKSRNKPFIIDFNNYLSFFTFTLHYVGISKKETAFERLVIRPHDKRLRILSNENPLSIGSRVTDEMVLFFFRIKSDEIKLYLNDRDFDEFGYNELEDYSRIISDAEKAFIKVMASQYNEVKFEKYPFSTDGLFDTKVEKRSFTIDENIIFLTDTNKIVCKRKKPKKQVEKGDFISVSKDKVDLIKICESKIT
ncbi:hypothetical protein [Olivibacter jilunii]|uniref:hypothetical protein n=1 Tax=Olivibacter jilunii TaxID=985016 RepID=UPI003F147697